MPSQATYRPTPISLFSDQRRTKSTTWSRTSCGTQLLVRAPQDFFLERHARPSTRPGPHPWSAPSSPRTQSVSASPPVDGWDVAGLGTRQLRSRRSPSASGRTPWAVNPVLHTGWKSAPCPTDAVSGWRPSLRQCSVYARSSYVLPFILTEERFLHFQLRQDNLGCILGVAPAARCCYEISLGLGCGLRSIDRLLW